MVEILNMILIFKILFMITFLYFFIKCHLQNNMILGATVPIANINLSTKFTGVKDNAIMINEKLYKKRGIIVSESRGGNYNITVPYEALIYKGYNCLF